MKVVEIIDAKNGVSLARTNTYLYLVGIGYKIGMEINTLNHTIDFCQTPSLEVARKHFEMKVGN